MEHMGWIGSRKIHISELWQILLTFPQNLKDLYMHRCVHRWIILNIYRVFEGNLEAKLPTIWRGSASAKQLSGVNCEFCRTAATYTITCVYIYIYIHMCVFKYIYIYTRNLQKVSQGFTLITIPHSFQLNNNTRHWHTHIISYQQSYKQTGEENT